MNYMKMVPKPHLKTTKSVPTYIPALESLGS